MMNVCWGPDIYKYKIAAAADQYVMHDEHARSFYLRVIKSDAMSDTNVWWIWFEFKFPRVYGCECALLFRGM